MATYNELAYDILEVLNNNNISDDEDVSIEHIMYQFNLQRALWIRNEYNKPGRTIDPQIEQDLGCLELEESDTADCCEINTGCIILRTKKIIPKLIEFHDKSGITRLGPVSKVALPFNFTTYDKAIYASFNKYAKGVFAFLLNQRIYCIITDSKYNYLDYINLRGVFENPEDLKEFQCNDEACFTYDKQYPVNAWMIPYLTEQVLNKYGISTKFPKDITNNAADTNITGK